MVSHLASTCNAGLGGTLCIICDGDGSVCSFAQELNFGKRIEQRDAGMDVQCRINVATVFLGDLDFLLGASTAQLRVIDSDRSGNCGMLRYEDVCLLLSGLHRKSRPFMGQQIGCPLRSGWKVWPCVQ
ncbi:hypothetical protein QQF64_002862 [Cirrhinus molitorella]|uniref:Uncharacterized protein n=1 Tax=Cirrhinus molitorella TaxID=172907 RepID=A0ABR3MRG5_9TELE